MNSKLTLVFAAAVAAGLVSCNKVEIPQPKFENGLEVSDVPVIRAIIDDFEAGTKTDFQFTDGVLKASWTAGDQIAICPGGTGYQYAGTYTYSSGSGSSASFTQVTPVTATSSEYVAFYPASKVKSFYDLPLCDFDGQIQVKSDPLAHLADYFVMYKDGLASYNTVNFTDAYKSSCMRVNLSGVTFNDPEKVTVSLAGSTFYGNCYDVELYSNHGYYPGAESVSTTNSISVDLLGYGTETELQAWIAMSNLNVTINAGTVVTVTVKCSDGLWKGKLTVDSPFTLTGGHCHSLTISSGWESSSVTDGEVIVLQEAETQTNLDLVIMGDGFIEEDFEGGDNSTYMNIMKNAANQFFDAEPYRYLRQFFNVYVVNAISPQRTDATVTGANGAQNNTTNTLFKVEFTPNSTRVSGDNETVLQYAYKAITGANADDRKDNVTVIVVANLECRSGTCWNWWYGDTGLDYPISFAVAYFGLGTTPEEGNQLVRHETAGHGFGKLADEYKYDDKPFTGTSLWDKLASEQAANVYLNVDKYVSQSIKDQYGVTLDLTTKDNVLWHDLFGTANNYEQTENLGVYEGGYVYATGFCRPTEDGRNSIMYMNTGIFNAVCRRIILHRANSLMGTRPGAYGSAEELAWFLNWDSTYMLPHMNEYLPSGQANSRRVDNFVEEYKMPLAPPVNIYGHKEGGKFVEDGRF